MIRRSARVLLMGWLFQFKQMSRSSFDSLLAVLWPLFFATVAFFMFRAGGKPDALVYASLGSAVMGIWTATSVAAGSALQRERWYGTSSHPFEQRRRAERVPSSRQSANLLRSFPEQLHQLPITAGLSAFEPS